MSQNDSPLDFPCFFFVFHLDRRLAPRFARFVLFTSPPIREPLALHAFYDLGKPAHVIHAELGSVAVAEVKFRRVAMKMGARAVLINPAPAATRL